jgi:hypothetical protein
LRVGELDLRQRLFGLPLRLGLVRLRFHLRLHLLDLHLRLHLLLLGIGLRRIGDEVALLVLLRLVQIVLGILDPGLADELLRAVVDFLLVDQRCE